MPTEIPKIKRHCIYKITCILTGKIYIGQTNDFKRRWRQHCSAARSKTPSLRIDAAIKKYKIENYIVEIIFIIAEPCICTPKNPAKCKFISDEIEKLMISQHDSHISLGNGYNVSVGGSNAPKSEITRKKISESRKGQAPWNKGTKGLMPVAWNKGTKGLIKSWNKGIYKLPWPSDKELTELAAKYTLTEISKQLDFNGPTLFKYLKNKNIKCIIKQKKGVFERGINHSGAKLTEQNVLKIVELCNTNNYTQPELAKIFNVSRENINSIVNGYNWSHITGIQPRKSKITKS